MTPSKDMLRAAAVKKTAELVHNSPNNNEVSTAQIIEAVRQYQHDHARWQEVKQIRTRLENRVVYGITTSDAIDVLLGEAQK